MVHQDRGRRVLNDNVSKY